MMQDLIQEMNNFYYTKRTLDVNFRKYYLTKLKENILKYKEQIAVAIYNDFKKPEFETYETEIYTVITELSHAIKNIKSWAKPQKYNSNFPVPLSYTKVIKEPYGVCVIFSPFNYPFQLAIAPLIGAIAAGNCAIIKPSEYTPNTTKVLKKIISATFPERYVFVVEGEREVCEELLASPIDYIFFTGSPTIGKVVMREAAKHLIPVTLELGGKSPAIVDYDADIKLAAKRIVWGKFLNGGQTCVAPDYILVHDMVVDEFIRYLIHYIKKFYSDKNNLAKIINESSYVRLLSLIDEDKVIYGGHFNTDELYIEPTLIYPANLGDDCMQEEIFGPILPIIPFKKLSTVQTIINSKPKPLALYMFGNDKHRIKHIMTHLSFGGGCVNDTILHFNNTEAPFGGVGYSGMGSYHGKYSFDTFTHEKSIFISGKHEPDLRYPPYDNALELIKKLLKFL